MHVSVSDGSVRADVELERAASGISAAVFGLAYQWALMPDDHDVARELADVRKRLVAAYSPLENPSRSGQPSARGRCVTFVSNSTASISVWTQARG